MDLSKYHTFGLSLLKLMLLVGSTGLFIVGIYEFCF